MSDDLGLAEAADLAGLHYMTLYRYVRTGRLAATRHGREWRVARTDVEALAAPPDAPEPARPRSASTARTRLEARMIAGDEGGAWRIVEEALASGMDPPSVHLRLLVPAMASIGARWAAGDIRVADEHRASAVAGRLVARLGPRLRPRGPRRGSVIVGAVTGDRHALPCAIGADLLRGAGFEAVDLGADVPAESFAHAAAEAHRLRAVVVSMATVPQPGALRRVCDALRVATAVPVLVGGAASEPGVATAAGASGHVDLDDLVEQVSALAD